MQHINLETFANGAFTAQVNPGNRRGHEEYSGPEHRCNSSKKDYCNDWI